MRRSLEQLKQLILILIIIQYTECSRTIEMRTDDSAYYFKVKVGTPPVEIKINPIIGVSNQFNTPEFIFDEQIKLFDYGQTDFYSYEKSTSAKQGEFTTFKSIDNDYERYSGFNVQDQIDYNGLKLNRDFIAINEVSQVYGNYQNGIAYFSKNKDSFIDIAYNQKLIQSRDYVLSGKQIQNANGNFFNRITNIINLEFDFNGNESYYNLPSLELTSDPEQSIITALGIYANNEDITDKLKYRKINLDYIQNPQNRGISLPKDIIMYIQNTLQISDDQQGIPNCKDCLCDEVLSMPIIKLVTNEFIFYITPIDYTEYQEYIGYCYIQANPSSGNSYDILGTLLFNNNIKIMYQKDSNSIRLNGLKTIHHINMQTLITVLSIINGLIFLALIYLAPQFILNFKYIKLEQLKYIKLNQLKHIQFETIKIQKEVINKIA